MKIYYENIVEVFFSKNGKYSNGTNHIKLKYLVVREKVKKRASIENISTTFMISDPLTKGFPHKAYKGHVSRMGLLGTS